MDPKPQMPDIKAEVNKVDDGKKKASGLLGGLFGSGGSGAAGGLGGLGAGASGVAGLGGLLATKAGILALVLMGSAVAGGIGLAGYKMFGPGEADKTGGNLSLFAPRTQPAVDPNAVAPVNADGSSASLNYMSAAAAKDKAAEDAANASASAAAPTDNTAGDAAKAAAAADAASRAAQVKAGGAINSGGGAGATGSMGQGLANVKKLGALSSGTGGGAATSASSGAAGRLGDNLSNASKNGASSAFSRQNGAAKTSSASRAVGGRSTSARTALRNVGIDQKGGRAGSSFAAGRTYDGTTAGGSGGIGPEGGAIGMGGAGDGAGAQPKTLGANSANQVNKQEPPPAEPPAKDVTPWAKEIMMGMALGGVAIALLMWGSSLVKAALAAAAAAVTGVAYALAETSMMQARIVIGIAMAAAAGGIVMGGMISGGHNGQVLQGGLLAASSTAILAAGALLFKAASLPAVAAGPTGLPAAGSVDKTTAAFASSSTWMYVIGGLGAVGLVGTMMSPKKTCKSDQDGCHAHYQQQPSPTNYSV